VISQHTTSDFADRLCTAPPARSDRMRDIVLAHLPHEREIRVLDFGCGTGSLLRRLGDALPAATLIGIDLSVANVETARRNQVDHAGTARVQFEAADYLTYRAEPFDVIVTDGVLHLVRAENSVLVRKLASDLRPGGLLVCAMPFDCTYNRVFAMVRRVLGRVRAPWLDWGILQVARLLHGREMDDDKLRERVPYMYIPPERMMDASLAACFVSAGLHPAAEYPAPSSSLSQLKHRVTIFVRRDA
jgi:SAM-dependent methyltransferase